MNRAIDVTERRARLATRQLLVSGGPEDVARALGVLHSTDPATVCLSVATRSPGFLATDLDRALFEEKTLVRMLGMRRTVFVVPAATAPVVQQGAAAGVAAVERRKLAGMVAESGVTDDPGSWLTDVEDAVAATLARLGESPAAALAKAEPRLATKLVIGAGTPRENTISASSRMLFLMAAEGKVVRGRPRGSWLSTQYNWSADVPAGLSALPVVEARAALARLWLAAYGPGSEADLKWWTGWTLGHTRKALADVEAVAVDLDGVTGYVLPDDTDKVAPAAPCVRLLPALDPTTMGWQGRAWYLGDHGPALFDTTGNAGPTVWVDGRIVGGWSQTAEGEIVWRLLTDVGTEAADQVAAEAGRLTEWLAGTRVTARGRRPSPLEKELATGGNPPPG